MSKIYKGQSSLRIRLTTGVDITSASELLIKYRKPGGTLGDWTATSEDDVAGIIFYDLVIDDLDETGNWIFWAHVIFSDSRTAPGQGVTVRVYEEGA
jgi:hypothetical protein